MKIIGLSTGFLTATLLSSNAFAQFSYQADDPLNSTINSFNDQSFQSDMFGNTDMFGNNVWGAEEDVIIVRGDRIKEYEQDIDSILQDMRNEELERELISQLQNQLPQYDEDEEEEMTEEEKCKAEQSVEGERDKVANEIAKEITSKRDWKRREYGAVIIRGVDGQLRVTILFRGSNFGAAVDFEFSMTRGETIVGAVHNHTSTNYNNPDGPSDDDWAVAKEWVEGGIAQAGSYSEYIVNYNNGSVAEFDYTSDFGNNAAGSGNRKDAKSEC